MLNGVDISHYQRGLDLASLKHDFAIMKATEGTSMVDECCDKWVQTERRNGKLWGFYHVLTTATGIAQGEFMLDMCENYFGEGIPIIDVEGTGSYYPNDPGRVYDMANYLIGKTGVKPIIYMNRNCMLTADWSRVVGLGCDLWIARYPYSKVSGYDYDTGNLGDAKYWPYYAMWQYTSNGWLASNNLNVGIDLDVFFGTEDAWRAYAAGSSIPDTDTSEMLSVVNSALESLNDATEKVQQIKDSIN